MKLHLPRILRTSLMSCMALIAAMSASSVSAAYTTTDNLGNTMYVGDSITHGIDVPSWRWAMHKIYVDNGITYTEQGVMTGKSSGGYTNMNYGGVVFRNVHSSASSARAYEISGQKDVNGRGSSGQRFGGTNIMHWLNQEDCKVSSPNSTHGAGYTIANGTVIDTFFILIGTNDLLSDGLIGNSSQGLDNNGNPTGNLKKGMKSLLGWDQDSQTWTNDGDMDIILSSMRANNENAQVVVLTIPTWASQNRANTFDENDNREVQAYNEQLKKWAATKEGVTVVVSDRGLVDVANETWVGAGVASMFRPGTSNQPDSLHPTVHGDLLIAGNVARQLGYAGRTAGQERKTVRKFEKHEEGITLAAGSGAQTYEWSTAPTGGYTAAFSIADGIGNGAVGGWNTTGHFSVSVGDGSIGGTLNINEAYIQWGDTILYSIDTSDTTLTAGGAYANINDTIRIAYVRGNAKLNLEDGFYVWMDDQLIGEGLTFTQTQLNGVSIENSTEGAVTLSDLWMDGTGSWAPSTSRESYDNPLIEALVVDADNPYSENKGVEIWPTSEGMSKTDIALSAANRTNISSGFSLGGRVVGGDAGSGNQAFITNGSGRNNAEPQDLYVTLVDCTVEGFAGFLGHYQGSASLFKGNGYLRILTADPETSSSYGTWFAVCNTADGFDGNLYMEFSADNVQYKGGSYNGVGAALAAVFSSAGGITGSFTIVINAGTFGSEATKSQGDIYGGSFNDTSTVGKGSFIYINGGTLWGNIYGAGRNGTVNGTSITITGNEMNFAGTTIITAGGTASGTVTGNSTITIADASETESGGFSNYTGTLDGGNATGTRSLIFEGTQLAGVQATLQNFDSISLGKSEASGKGSKVGLNSLGGATTINISTGSTLTLLEGIDLGSDPLTISNQGGTVILENGVNLKVGSTGDQQAAAGSYELQSGSSLSMTADSLGSFSILMDSGSSVDLSATTSGLQATIVLDDTEAAGRAVYNINGLGDGKRLTLSHFTAGSSIVGLGEDDDITLAGANRVTLVSGANGSAETALLQGGALGVEQGAELVVDINGIVGDMAAGTDATLTYYLSKGGFADVEALKGAMSFDATLVALGWKVDMQQSGTLVFSRATGEDLLGGKVLLSDSSEAESVWNSSEIYTDTAAYDAIVVNDDAYIDLRDKEVPSSFAETGLLIKNLMGSSDLTVQGDAATGEHKVTLSNRLDQSALDELAAEGFYVDKSLTYSGNITIIDAQLCVAHMNPADLTADTESATIVQGDVKLVGTGGVDMAGGVLELLGQGNDFGEGDLVFSAGDAGQVVVNGGRLTLHGAVSAQASAGATREHIRLENAGVLALADGAAVQQGVIIGDAQGNIMDYAHSSAGTLAVVGQAALSAGAQVQYVHMLLAEDSQLTIIGSVSKAAAQSINAPEPASVPTAPGIVLRGLSGSGALVTQNTTGEEGDLVIAVAGGTHTFTGNLADYNGTMYVSYSPYAQVFSGVKGGSDWNLVNYMGNVVFNLMGEDGTAGNTLTMGELVLASGSSTTILMDLTSPKRGGLNLSGLEIESGAAVTIGHHDGTTTLAGENGETRRIAVGVISSAQGALIDEGVRWSLVNVRNAELVDLVYENDTLYLVYGVDNSNKYAAVASNINSLAGAQLLWEIGEQSGLTGDLGAVDRTLLKLVSEPTTPGNIAQANKLLAAAAGASSAVLAQAAGADVERQLRTMRNRAATIGLPDSGGKESRTSVWMNAETSYYKLDADGCMPGFKSSGWGGTVGLHTEHPAGVSLGLALTAMYNDLETAGPDRLKGDMDNYYLSGIVRMTEGAWQHTFIATVGTADIDARRTVNYGEGAYTTHLSTDGMSFGLMYELGYAIPLNDERSAILQPIANIAWRYSQLDAYSETGSDAALSVAEQSFSSVVFGLGARLQAAAGESLWNTAGAFELRALIKANAGDRAGKAQVAFSSAGLSSASVQSAESGVIGLELGAGVSVPVSSSSAIYADFSAELGNGRTDLNATLGYKLTF